MVDVEIKNRMAHLVSDYDIETLTPFWSYSHPRYNFIKRYYPGWDGKIKLLKYNRVPVGLFWATRKEIRDEVGIRFKVFGELESLKTKSKNNIFSEGKWDFQNRCVDRMLEVSRFGGGLIVNATGSGKTRIAAMFFSRISGRACFLVDQILLLEQSRDAISEALNEEVGWIGDSIFDPKRITIATVQTMAKKKNSKEFKQWSDTLDVIMIDEIHEQMAKRNFKIVEGIKPLAVYGLTATIAMQRKPVRLQATALAGPVCFNYPLVQGQAEGVLGQGVATQVTFVNQLETPVQKVLGWGVAYRRKIVANPLRNALLAALVGEAYKRGKFTIILVSRVQHLSELSSLLAHIPHRVVSGTFEDEYVELEDRMTVKRAFEAGKLRVLICNAVFKKGIDIKRVDCIIDGAATKSENDVIQKFGRGVRLHDDKAGLLYFDIGDYDSKNKENWFNLASISRYKALKQVGIKVEKFRWDSYVFSEIQTETLFNEAEKRLLKELE